jgi:hypothetical protein
MARNALLLLDMLAAMAMVDATRATMHGQPNAASFGGKRMTYMRKESKEAAASGGALDHIAKSEESEQSAAAATAAKTRITLERARQLRMVASASIRPLLYAVITNWKLKRGRWQTDCVKMDKAKVHEAQMQGGSRRHAIDTCRQPATSVTESGKSAFVSSAASRSP